MNPCAVRCVYVLATLSCGCSALGSGARDPETWGPIAGALVVSATGVDTRVADWAGDTCPIFGSPRTAGRFSDGLLAATAVVFWATAMAPPDTSTTRTWIASTARKATAGLLAVGGTLAATDALKRSTHRQRPDATDHRSFPSGHATRASSLATLAREDARDLPVSHSGRLGLKIGVTMLGVATAWARVEARKHYPTDVLAGWSLGHVASRVVNDLIVGSTSSTVAVDVDLAGGVTVAVYRPVSP